MSVFDVSEAIAVLAILIIVHELGHFTAARLQGIHVNRFSLGFGPIL
jgi:membrane-associated protease RseP (regulator of RpoE activity)